MKYIGNCGCRRTTWHIVHFQPLQETTLIKNCPSPFQQAFAGNFIKAKNVLAVPSNMNVSNVGQPTRLFDVVGQNHLPLHHAPPRHMPLPTPIKISRLEFYLDGYPPASKCYLLDAFVRGFSLDYVGCNETSSCNNLLSSIQNPLAVNEELPKELNLGSIPGPFSEKPFSSLRLSLLGLTPKKAPREFHLVHHLSFPYCTSVNSHIPMEHLQYATHQSMMLLELQARAVHLQKEMSKMPFNWSRLTQMITTCLVFFGKTNFIMISACPWAVAAHVRYLKHLAPR